MKQFTAPAILIIVTALTITACRKAIESGKTITASGIVFDEVKNKPLPNATLYLYGAKQTLYGISYSNGPLDSTVSDINGKFSIQFTADGHSVDYGLKLGQLEYGGYTYDSLTNYVVDKWNPIFTFNYSTNVTNAIVKGRELNYLKLHLRVLANPYDTFLVRTDANRVNTMIIGQSIDTTVILRHLPGQANIIDYSTDSFRDTIGLAALNASSYGHLYGFRRMAHDTIIAGMTDTLLVEKTINTSLSIPRL